MITCRYLVLTLKEVGEVINNFMTFYLYLLDILQEKWPGKSTMDKDIRK